MEKTVGTSDTYKWWVLATVSTGSMIYALDNSILVTALPQLAAVFRADPSVISWVNLSYFITSQSLILTLGKLGDTRGRKKVFICGLILYLCGLLICAMSQNVSQLILGRAVQGIGAATGQPLAMAIAVAVFPPWERGKALGILTGGYSAGLVGGPIVGGFVLDLLGWRALFYARTPLVLAAVAVAWMVIREQKETDEHFSFDKGGAMALFGLLSSLLLYLSFGGKLGFTSGQALLLLAVLVIFLFSFVMAEKRNLQPIIQIDLFKNRFFLLANLSTVFMSVAFSHIVFLIPFYMIRGLGYSGSVVGTYMALLAAPYLVASPLSGRLSDRIGSRFLSTFGMGLVCVAMYMLMRLGGQPAPLSLAVTIGLAGTGISIFLPPNNSAILGSVAKDKLGIASAIAATSRQMGISGGVALAGATFTTHQSNHLNMFLAGGLDLAEAEKAAAVAGFHGALLIGLMVAAVGIATSLIQGSAYIKDTH